MKTILADTIAGIGMLIAIFLFLNNYTGTVKIINSISSNTVAGIKVLQGR